MTLHAWAWKSQGNGDKDISIPTYTPIHTHVGVHSGTVRDGAHRSLSQPGSLAACPGLWSSQSCPWRPAWAPQPMQLALGYALPTLPHSLHVPLGCFPEASIAHLCVCHTPGAQTSCMGLPAGLLSSFPCIVWYPRARTCPPAPCPAPPSEGYL